MKWIVQRGVTALSGALVAVALGITTFAHAQPNRPLHPLSEIERMAVDFARTHTADQQGQVEIDVHTLDPRTRLFACGRTQAYLPSGTRLWGRTSVAVRCQEAGGWTINVPVTVRVLAPVLVTTRAGKRREGRCGGPVQQNPGSDATPARRTDRPCASGGQGGGGSVARRRNPAARQLRGPTVITRTAGTDSVRGRRLSCFRRRTCPEQRRNRCACSGAYPGRQGGQGRCHGTRCSGSPLGKVQPWVAPLASIHPWGQRAARALVQCFPGTPRQGRRG